MAEEGGVKSACHNWDRDWGDCGRCAPCLQRGQGERAEERLRRIERQLERLMEHMGLEAEQ